MQLVPIILEQKCTMHNILRSRHDAWEHTLIYYCEMTLESQYVLKNQTVI